MSRMKIVSIDVGIKNLAIVYFSLDDICGNLVEADIVVKPEDKVTILKWDVVNLTRMHDATCCGKEKDNTSNCKSEVKFSKNGKYYCTKHSKLESYMKPCNELSLKFLKKQKVSGLQEVASKHCIDYTQPIKKADLLDLIYNFGQERCFDAVDKIDATKLDIVTIGRNIQYKLNEMFKDSLGDIDRVIIENQISPIANRMKTVQGMLSQYFLMSNNKLDIEFISSINKLKDDDIHETYAERKKAGIKKCLEMLVGKHNEWLNFFNLHKKKDDLADCFLQGMWYVKYRT